MLCSILLTFLRNIRCFTSRSYLRYQKGIDLSLFPQSTFCNNAPDKIKESNIKLKNSNKKKKTVICNDQTLLRAPECTLLHNYDASTPQVKVKHDRTKQFPTRLQFEP